MEEQQGKVCTKCKQWKPLEEFNKNKNYKDGRQHKCRECQKECNKQWRENNKEHIEEYNKQWRENNPGYHNSEQQKQYREVNKEKKKEYDKQYRKDNIEEIREYDKQRYRDNIENNLQYISSIVNQVRPIFRELNLPVYGYIYKFENVKTGRVYIGQTTQPLKIRYGQEGGIIKSWIKERSKYNGQKFLDELIEDDIIVTELFDVGCCKYHLDKTEAYYIDKYDSCNNGYNNEHGNHITDDGLEEFNQILLEHNLKFTDGKLIKVK